MAKMEGRDALKRKFDRMPQAVRQAVAAALPAAAAELVAMQKRLAPSDTGALRASIRQEPSREAEGFGVKVIAGGTAETRREVRKGSGIFTDVAKIAEFGTKKHRNQGKFAGSLHPGTKARPFFYPAYRAIKTRLRSKVSRAMRNAIKQGAR